MVRTSHLREDLVQPLEGPVEVDFYPAGSTCYVLPVVFGTPTFYERHSEKSKRKKKLEMRGLEIPTSMQVLKVPKLSEHIQNQNFQIARLLTQTVCLKIQVFLKDFLRTNGL